MARTGEVQMCNAAMKSFQRCFPSDIRGLSLLFTNKEGEKEAQRDPTLGRQNRRTTLQSNQRKKETRGP